MAKQIPYSGKPVEGGPLAGHFRRGRRYTAPLAALHGSMANDWVRDDLPDLIWPLMLVALRADRGAVSLRKFQELALSTLGQDVIERERMAFDGRLTSLGRTPAEIRPQLLAAIRGVAGDLLPPEILGVLRLYPSVPGGWLLIDPWGDLDAPSEEESLNFLASSIVKVVSDRHTNALTKIAPFGWSLMTGNFRIPRGADDLVEAIVDYPTIPENIARADAYILSAFLTTKVTAEFSNDSIKSERLDWANRFWTHNRKLSACLYEHELLDDQAQVEDSEPEGQRSGSISGTSTADPLVTSYLREIDSIFAEVLDWFFDPGNDTDLHNPSRSEVLAGLFTRSIRSTAAVIMAPHMWTGEHGAGFLRSLFETIVVLKWMISKDDDGIFDRYQSYGWGKRKLHTKQLKEELDSDEGESSDFLTKLVEHMERKGPGEVGDQFQEVNLEATFSGVPLRAMADEVGELERYNRLFQTSSGVGHGEWWALEDYALERCHNPLHRFHWIPRLNWNQPRPEVRFPTILLALLREITALVLGSAKPEVLESPGPRSRI